MNNNSKPANSAEYSIDKQPAEMSDNDYSKLMGSLNSEQAQVVTFVQDWCKQTVACHNKSVTGRSDVAPFYRFVSGSGSVGKSHVINAVYQTCKKLLKPLQIEDPEAPSVTCRSNCSLCVQYRRHDDTLEISAWNTRLSVIVQ